MYLKKKLCGCLGEIEESDLLFSLLHAVVNNKSRGGEVKYVWRRRNGAVVEWGGLGAAFIEQAECLWWQQVSLFEPRLTSARGEPHALELKNSPCPRSSAELTQPPPSNLLFSPPASITHKKKVWKGENQEGSEQITAPSCVIFKTLSLDVSGREVDDICGAVGELGFPFFFPLSRIFGGKDVNIQGQQEWQGRWGEVLV